MMTPRMSEARYAGTVGIFMLWGLSAFGLGTIFGQRLLSEISWLLPFVGLALGFLGTEIATHTPKWHRSFLGLIITGCGYGLVAALIWQLPAAIWVREAFYLILLGTALLTALAFVRPRWVEGFGVFFPATLLAWLILWANDQIIPQTSLALGIPSLLLATVALAYLDRYWTRSLTLEFTLDNAVDVACAVYTDGFNALLALLDRRSI